MIEALTLALEQARQIEAQKAVIAEQAVSVAALDRIAGTDGTMPPTSAAKVLKIAPRELIRWLDANGWTYVQGGERRAYSVRVQSGDLVQIIHDIGEGRSRVQVRVTAAGVAKLAKWLPKGGQVDA
jgi:phage antirepressor YoqD-like protein